MAEIEQGRERLFRFATRSLLLVGAANRLVVTPGTLLLGWCRGQKRLVERFPNDCSHLCDGISAVPIEWDNDFGESACRSAKIQSSAIDLQLSMKEFFSYQRIESWLQGFSACDDLPVFSISLAGLVIADANAARRMALDEVDRTAHLDAAVEIHLFGTRMRVGLSSFCIATKSERELESPGHVSRVVFARPTKPLA